MAYDMVLGGRMGSRNLLFNSLIDNHIALSGLYSNPCMGLGFSRYSDTSNADFLLNPLLPVLQTMIGAGAGGGLGMGMGMLPGMDMTSMWKQLLGLDVDPSKKKEEEEDNDDESETSTDIANQRKYNKLLSLMKALEESEYINDDDKKAEISAAIRNTKGSYADKYTRLKTVYDTISDTVVKNTIIEAEDLGYKDDSKAYYDSFQGNLQDNGFEYENTEGVDKHIDALYENIKKISDKQGNIQQDEILGNLQIGADSKYKILDLISSWNSKYSNDAYDNSEKRILSHIGTSFNKMKDGDIKKSVLDYTIAPLVTALKTEAEEVKSNKYLPKADKSALDNAITKLNKEFNKLGENIKSAKITDALVKAFDEVYLLTRLNKMALMTRETVNYYKEIDAEVFTSDMFETETLEDLKNEGFDIDGIEVTVIDGNEPVETNITKTNIDKHNGEKQAEALVAEGIVKKATDKVTIDGTEYEVYEEVKGSRKFIVKDDGLYEITEDGSEYKAAENKTKASDIWKAYDKKVKEEEDAAARAEEEAGREEAAQNYDLTAAQKTTADSIGQKFWDGMRGYTDETKWASVMSALDDVNSTNVLRVINKFNTIANSKKFNWGTGKQHFFQYLLNETNGGKTDVAIKMLGYVIENAETLKGLVDDTQDAELDNYIAKLKEQISYLDESEKGSPNGKYIDDIVLKINKMVDTVSRNNYD